MQSHLVLAEGFADATGSLTWRKCPGSQDLTFGGPLHLFPLQPQAPTIPLVVIGLCGWVLWIGAGSWSVDLRSAR